MPEKYYRAIEIAIGFPVHIDLGEYLIKNPLWNLIKYVTVSDNLTAGGEPMYYIVLNRLITEQELNNFSKVIDSLGYNFDMEGIELND